MAFPFTFESNFETGDSSEWDSETDTASQLDFPSYKDLARLPHRTAAPYSGAYCMRVVLDGDTADAFVLEGDLNIAADGNEFIKFDMWISPDFDATADDTINIFEAQSTGPVVEATFGMRYVAATDVINFGIGETAPTSWGSLAIERGVWYTIELDITLDDGGSNDGTIDLYVTKEGDKPGAVHASQVASLDQAAVIQGVLGVQGQLATTTGTILFDNFVSDDARVFPRVNRWHEEVLLTKSAHAFVGPGVIQNITLLAGAGTDCVLSVFDTDEANVDDANNIVVELKNTANSETVDPAGVPVQIHKGAYVQLAGTNPRAMVQMKRVDAFGTAAAVRRIGGR